MKNTDIKSLIIGVLGTVLVFVLIGGTTQDENFGHINANSITVKTMSVVDENGIPQVLLGVHEYGGFLTLSDNNENKCAVTVNTIGFGNKDNRLLVSLGTNDYGGNLDFYNENGKTITTLSSGKDGGSLMIRDNQGSPLFSLMTNVKVGGMMKIGNPIDDSYISFVDGKLMFTYNGKINIALNKGYLQTYNERGNKTTIVGTNDNGDGTIILLDKDGNVNWGK